MELLQSNVSLTVPDSWQALTAFAGAALALCVTVWRIGDKFCKAVKAEVKRTVTAGVHDAFELHRKEHDAITSVIINTHPREARAAGLTVRPWDGEKPERDRSPNSG